MLTDQAEGQLGRPHTPSQLAFDSIRFDLTCKHLDRSSASGLTQLSLEDAYMYCGMRAHFRVREEVNSQS